METVVTKYPFIGVELREYSFYDGRGEGARDCGSEVYTLDGALVDTSGSMTPATWVMEQLIQQEKDDTKQAAIARIRADLLVWMAKSQTPKVRKEIEKMEANLARLRK